MGQAKKSLDGIANVDATIANEAGLGLKRLTEITKNVAEIYEANGFSGDLFNFKILGKGEGKKQEYWDGLFVALVNESSGFYTKGIGASLPAGGNASIIGWDESNGLFQSFVNIGIATDAHGFSPDLSWNVGYVIAHEFLHQLLYILPPNFSTSSLVENNH